MAKKTISEIREEPGMSNAGKYKNVSKDDFCGPKGTYPVNSLDRAKSALKLAHNAKDPEAIKSCVYTKFPELKKGSKMSRRGKDGASMKSDPDIKAAKKKIRKGANVLGGSNIVDDFGHKHGYNSDEYNELANSRLVQRKERKTVRKFNKSEIKDLKSKESKKEWNDPKAIASGYGGNKARKEEISELRADTKDMKKASKKGSKIARKVTKLENKKAKLTKR